jgi:hypothetical protein
VDVLHVERFELAVLAVDALALVRPLPASRLLPLALTSLALMKAVYGVFDTSTPVNPRAIRMLTHVASARAALLVRGKTGTYMSLSCTLRICRSRALSIYVALVHWYVYVALVHSPYMSLSCTLRICRSRALSVYVALVHSPYMSLSIYFLSIFFFLCIFFVFFVPFPFCPFSSVTSSGSSPFSPSLLRCLCFLSYVSSLFRTPATCTLCFLSYITSLFRTPATCTLTFIISRQHLIFSPLHSIPFSQRSCAHQLAVTGTCARAHTHTHTHTRRQAKQNTSVC